MPPYRVRVSFSFPSGDHEVRYLRGAPDVGDTLTMYGKDWTVESVEGADEGPAVVSLGPPKGGGGTRMPVVSLGPPKGGVGTRMPAS